VEAIFPESPLNPRLERALAREAGVAVGDRLWGDSLGPAGSDGATYLDAMGSETAAMVKGMTGGGRRCRPDA
jgi:ABC-type Zn uptake system ZnuABC Zn-binding protein ZnuA